MGISITRTRNAPPSVAQDLPALPGIQVAADLLDRLFAHAQVGLAYGEPQRVGERTIIPIGAVAYGFGFGGGTSNRAGRRRGRSLF